MTPTLKTERLSLRPLAASDAATIQALCGNSKVARMLARVPHPYPEGQAERWIASHPAEHAIGRAYHFGIELDGALIGIVGLERTRPGSFELGYWLGEAWWGRGLMSEAARRVVAFGFEALAAEELTSNHFLDNPASGRVLEKAGFRPSGPTEIWCLARDARVPALTFVLPRRGAGSAAESGAGAESGAQSGAKTP